MSQLAPPRTDFSHVPVTFSSYLKEQLRNWVTLFPAERRYLERLSKYLEKAPKEMFARLEAIERKMGVTPEKWPRERFTLEQVDFLNRNPSYPEWRAEIARLFGEIDPVLDAEVMARGRTRLIVVISPADLPVGPDRMWTRLAGKGRRLSVQPPESLDEYLALLLAGEASPGLGTCLADLAAEREPYASWIIETGSNLGAMARHSGVVKLSYERLASYRNRLMAEVERMTEDRTIRGPRQLSERLRGLRIRPDESSLHGDPVLEEFTRATLLAGNGTLLINNTFVEWAGIQAIRRARPHVLIAGFGIRNKVKPFSSLLIFHDQRKATAIPDQGDMLGSYVDLEVFYQYIWQEAAKQPEFRNNTACLFAATGMDELLLIAPLDFPLGGAGRHDLRAIYQAARDWIAG